MSQLLDTALNFHKHGISVVPVRADGTKRPAGNWKHYTDSRATTHEIKDWFTDTGLGLGLVTGAISGNLEMLEVEGRAATRLGELKQLAHDSGLGDLWDRITSGWFELSPSGGFHWFYRVNGDPIPGNTKIAQAANRETLAETRGEHGFVVMAPTAGTVHPTGKAWQLLAGGPDTIPTISTGEREALHNVFSLINEYTQPEAEQPNLLDQALSSAPFGDRDGTSPGDDFENKTDWTQILTGWTLVTTRGRTRYWRRPGKTDPGFSATTGHADDRDRLYVFSSSTEFEQETPYTKFGAYALLNHGGDHTAAAQALKKDGYGSEPTRAVTPLPQSGTQRPDTGTQPATNGSSALATVHQLDDRRHTPGETIATTDDGNAIALINEYGSVLRYCHDRGRWLYWDGAVWKWQPADGGQARELAKRVARSFSDTENWRLHKKKTLSAKGITDMLTQARTDTRITVAMDDLDARPWELNTPGGIIDLTTGQLIPADPSHLHTRTTKATPDATADTSLWDQFIATTFNNDTDLIGYMQRLAGYSVVGEVRDHILPFAYGSGGNGKSVFLDTMISILGDYATSSPNGFLMASNYSQHTTEIARLKGARFVVCNEVNETDRFDEAKVKMLTGGDTLTARFMRQDDFTFTPTHHIWLAGNFQPHVESGGDSFWRRLRLIPFTHTVPKDKQIEGLKEMLANEHGPAILAWVAQGAAAYHAAGMQEPPMVKEATNEYAATVDTVGRFLEEECEITSPYRPGLPATATTAVRAAYEKWCDENGETAIRGRAFPAQLARHGVSTGRNVPKGANGQRLYGGIALLSRQVEMDLHDGDRGGY